MKIWKFIFLTTKSFTKIADDIVEETTETMHGYAKLLIEKEIAKAKEEGKAEVLTRISEAVAHQEHPFSYIGSKIMVSDTFIPVLGAEI